ncbi:MAG: META domain-containing protein [Acidobacteria bacterium]|nr:META domain-containing protein [Acidobacteriota bacterium]
MRAMRRVVLMAAVFGVMAMGQAEPVKGLAGTKWRLVEIQSMDDAAGVKKPAPGTDYVMSLNADGSVVMKLNCNTARGKWTAKAGADGMSGEFRLGPLATTRMMCPGPSLDGAVAGQAEHVRSFLLKDGRLSLSLMADGGIQVWAPEAGRDEHLEAAVLKAAPSYTKAAAGETVARYAASRVDLNGDGKEEVFVYLMGPFFCGTGGCELMLFRDGPGGYELVEEFSITRTPVIVSQKKTHGWSDVWRAESGGGAKASFVRHSFDGKKYVARERVAGSRAPAGKQALTNETTFEKGTPLPPQR